MRGEEEQPRSISRLGSLPLAGSNSALSSVLHIHVSSIHLNLIFSQLLMFLHSIPFVSHLIIIASLKLPFLISILSIRYQP